MVLSKVLPGARIFSFTIMNYLKKFIGIKSPNTKQCPAGSSPRIITSLPVSSRLFPPLTEEQQS